MSEFVSDGCSMFPDLWIKHCCVAHDLANHLGIPDSLADQELFQCVVDASVDVIGYGWGIALAGLMMVGLGIGRPMYIKLKARKEKASKEKTKSDT